MLQAAMPILMMFGIFYFIILRPQARKQKEFQAMIAKLGKGDEVYTRGGVIGKITGVSDDGLVVLEIQEKVRIRILRSYIEGKWDGKVPQNAPQSNAA
ncbi:MAG: preprotein translocase subunit YajC [Deltaproteobacteria bacterium]|nr:preprotein translocase subunit YajC [Deltaproteobacteria bacterium]